MGGGSAGESRGSARRRAEGRRRLALAVFASALVLLFVGFAVAQGIGAPSVPTGAVAIVEGAPGDLSTVTQEAFDYAMEQQAAQAKLSEAPEPGTEKYEELKESALGELLNQAWIHGEADELGVHVTEAEVEDQLATVKSQSFPEEGSFEKFLQESKFTQQDVDERIELQLLTTKIQEQVNEEAPEPSESEIEDYYEAEKDTLFTEKESRDVRVVINTDKGEVEAAKKLLEQDSSPGGWQKAAKKHSSDATSSGKGGLQEGITEEFLQEPIKAAVFDSRVGELVGPFKVEANWFLLEVVSVNQPKVKSLDEVEAQIAETLKGEQQQQYFGDFVNDYQSKWESRTYCADGYLVDLCGNAKGPGHPSDASAACYEEDPKVPAAACPAPVAQTRPAVPGTVTPTKSSGEQLPQGPQP